jgi:hypothetical protein
MKFEDVVASLLGLMGRRVAVYLWLRADDEYENVSLALGTLSGGADLARVRRWTKAALSDEDDPLTSHPAFQALVARDVQGEVAEEFGAEDVVRFGFEERSLAEGFFLHRSQFRGAQWIVNDDVPEGEFLRIDLAGDLRMEILAPGAAGAPDEAGKNS